MWLHVRDCDTEAVDQRSAAVRKGACGCVLRITSYRASHARRNVFPTRSSRAWEAVGNPSLLSLAL